MKAYSLLLTIAAGTVLMSSCSLYNKLLGKDESVRPETNTVLDDNAIAQAPAKTPAPVIVIKKPETANQNSTNVETNAQQKVESKAEKKTETKTKIEHKSESKNTVDSNYHKPNTDELCGGQWLVASVGEYTIEAEENGPYINFDNSGRYYASDGCNILNGDYVLHSNGVISFDNSLSTMRYCADVEYAPLITAMFNGSMQLKADCKRAGHDTYLYLKDDKGKTVGVLRRQNMEFLNGQWRVTSIEGQKIDDEEANIFIDIAELKMHGNTGCNSVNGKLYINPLKSNSINFSDMAVTFMLCHKGDQERKMLVALEQTETAISGKNDDSVIFLDNDGKELMTLKRVHLNNK